MKKFLLVCTLFFLLTINVDAEAIRTFDLEKGNIYSKDEILNSATNTYRTVTADLTHIIYVDKENNLLEAFTATAGAELTFFDDNNLYNYSTDMYLHKSVEFNFGNTCQKVYSKFSKEHEKWCDKYLTMYSSKKDISKINYWKVESVDEIRLSEFCETTPEVQNSFSCTDGLDKNKMSFGWWAEENPNGLYDSYPVIILKEYAPAEFKLECSPKEVKKGQTSNCQLKVNSEEKITQIIINKSINNVPFNIKDIKQTEDWEVIDNKNGIITLKNEEGFEGEGTILDLTIELKEDITDEVNIELKNIDYVTSNGHEFNFSVKENVKVYKEIKNPETRNQIIGILCLLGIIIFTNIFIHYKNRKNIKQL